MDSPLTRLLFVLLCLCTLLCTSAVPNVKKEIIEHGVEVDATSSPPTTAPAAAAGEDAAIRAAVADAAATLSALNLKSVPDSAADSEDAAATANAGAGQAATPNAEANQEVGVVVDSETGAAATLEAENTEMKTADRLADVNGDDMHEINLFGSKIKVPKNPTPSKKRGEKRGYTPPPIPDICDKDHCAGCLHDKACVSAGECMWNKKKSVCYPKKIKLFGHEIDLSKLHEDEV